MSQARLGEDEEEEVAPRKAQPAATAAAAAAAAAATARGGRPGAAAGAGAVGKGAGGAGTAGADGFTVTDAPQEMDVNMEYKELAMEEGDLNLKVLTRGNEWKGFEAQTRLRVARSMFVSIRLAYSCKMLMTRVRGITTYWCLLDSRSMGFEV